MHNYVHRSNARLNGRLTLVAVVIAAVVVGLGVGHFIGECTNFRIRLDVLVKLGSRFGCNTLIMIKITMCIGKALFTVSDHRKPVVSAAPLNTCSAFDEQPSKGI